MKKTVILLGFFLAMVSCNSVQKEQKREKLVGADRDKHGCISSAGFTWSELQQTCVQLWEAGIRLNPVEIKEGEAVISAFVLFSKDESKVEIFLPNGKKSIILDKETEYLYEKREYLYNDKEGTISVNGKIVYKKENN